MAKILVLYHSLYGHIETMAQAEAEGAREVPGSVVTLKRVPETMSDEAMRQAGGKLSQAAPIATPNELADYDAIIFGTPTRFGNMTGQMRTFLDHTGGLWLKGALIGKLGSVFTDRSARWRGSRAVMWPNSRRGWQRQPRCLLSSRSHPSNLTRRSPCLD